MKLRPHNLRMMTDSDLQTGASMKIETESSALLRIIEVKAKLKISSVL